jgi:hypothetical protein
MSNEYIDGRVATMANGSTIRGLGAGLVRAPSVTLKHAIRHVLSNAHYVARVREELKKTEDKLLAESGQSLT